MYPFFCIINNYVWRKVFINPYTRLLLVLDMQHFQIEVGVL